MSKVNFSDEFKQDAVRQITERGYPVSEVSKRLGHPVQPGPAVFIGEGNSAPHFVNIDLRVKVVSFAKYTIEFFRQESADGRLACAGYSH